MTNRTKLMTAFLLAGLVISVGIASAGLWGGSSSASSDTPDIQQKKVIVVSGYGTVDTTPDEAVVRLAVVTQAEDAKEACDENAKKMDAVLAALNDTGIAEGDSVTSDYRVWPRYNWKDGEDRLIGFQVRNSLTATVRDIEKVGDVIDAAIGAGANEIGDVAFTVSDDRQAGLREEAIADAVAKARSDANSVADAMDVAIVGALEISTTGSQFSPYRVHLDYGYYEDAEMEMPMPAPKALGAGPQIQPGDVTVSAYVTVVYEFK